jgi:hypothetical protein
MLFDGVAGDTVGAVLGLDKVGGWWGDPNLVNVVCKAIASLQLKNRPSASAPVADEMTGFIMAERKWTAPLSGGGIPLGSVVAAGYSGRLLRTN